MTTRLLSSDEWPKLAGTELGKFPLPPNARVLVVEDGEQVVGCWSLFPVWHAEGVWVEHQHRGHAAVFRHLVRGMRALAHSLGTARVVTSAMDPMVERLLKRAHAVKVPGEFYVLE